MPVSTAPFRVAQARKPFRAVTGIVMVAAALAGCAQAPPPSHHYARNSKEHFAEGKYGHASPRMVDDGTSVPKGGGQYLVGRPYTIAGHTYYPQEVPNYVATGMASWYGDAFHGRRTANGEIYDMRSISAAHPTMPLPSYARVTNLTNGNSIIVRVNDRGPYHGGRVMDVSSRTADLLDFKGAGTAHVRVEYVGRAPMDGSDDSQLLASLRTDGAPAAADGVASTLLAAAETVTLKPAAAILDVGAGVTVGAARSVAGIAAPAPPPRRPEVTETVVAATEPTRPQRPEALAPLPPVRPFEFDGAPPPRRDYAAADAAPTHPSRLRPGGDGAIYYAPHRPRALKTLRDDPFRSLDVSGVIPFIVSR